MVVVSWVHGRGKGNGSSSVPVGTLTGTAKALQPRRRRKHVPPKYWYQHVILHSDKSLYYHKNLKTHIPCSVAYYGKKLCERKKEHCECCSCFWLLVIR